MCEKCTRERVTLAKVPKNVPWTRCARCGIIDFQGKWSSIASEDLWHELVQRNVEFHHDIEDLELGLIAQEVDGRHTLIHLEIDGAVDGLAYNEKYSMRARMSNGVCLTCARRAGNYFEATVQVRSSARRLSDEEFELLRATLDTVMAEMPDDPMFFITSEGPVTGGYDVVLGSKSLARAWGRHLVSKHGGQVTATTSVVGRKDGADLTRLTLLYRKPGYSLGDIIRWRGELWRPASWTGEGAILEKIEKRERTGATWRDLENANVISRIQEFVYLDAIGEDSSVAEFLDPRTWKMSAVRLPFEHVPGRNLLLARVDDEWVCLPRLGMDGE
jgi:nonsense-mediated mRNA decay protein 3|tara:strand:+ start:927 stop:1919 length:993 start_codon:yes stop_codon:yes gene_type:complete